MIYFVQEAMPGARCRRGLFCLESRTSWTASGTYGRLAIGCPSKREWELDEDRPDGGIYDFEMVNSVFSFSSLLVLQSRIKPDVHFRGSPTL